METIQQQGTAAHRTQKGSTGKSAHRHLSTYGQKARDKGPRIRRKGGQENK